MTLKLTFLCVVIEMVGAMGLALLLNQHNPRAREVYLVILISAPGSASNVLKIRPPLVFRREHAEILLDRLEQTLNRLPKTNLRL